jgi:hypothetical protein
MEVVALVLYHPPKDLSSLRLMKIVNNRYYPHYDEPDAHQIIEYFGENHHYDAKDNGNDSSDET